MAWLGQVTDRTPSAHVDFHCDGLDESITYGLLAHIPLDSGPAATREARSPSSPGSNAGWSRPLEAIGRLLLCTVFAVCTVGYTSAMTFTLSPADTTVGPGDDVVLRVLTDATPDIKGVSLDWSYTAPRLTFVSAHAGGVITQPSGFIEFVNADVAPADS